VENECTHIILSSWPFYAKKCQTWWKFDAVLTKKTILLSFFWGGKHCVPVKFSRSWDQSQGHSKVKYLSEFAAFAKA